MILEHRRTAYRRKISSEEAREGYVFVTKDAAGFFPPVGAAFSVRWPEGQADIGLFTVDCSCVGTPHIHYRLVGSLPFQLSKGLVIEFSQTGDNSYSGAIITPPVVTNPIDRV
jgi:hypothetical protein